MDSVDNSGLWTPVTHVRMCRWSSSSIESSSQNQQVRSSGGRATSKLYLPVSILNEWEVVLNFATRTLKCCGRSRYISILKCCLTCLYVLRLPVVAWNSLSQYFVYIGQWDAVLALQWIAGMIYTCWLELVIVYIQNMSHFSHSESQPQSSHSNKQEKHSETAGLCKNCVGTVPQQCGQIKQCGKTAEML